ncbi:MAG: tetratricopeptide repeat protein [Verrucomicrobiota bacterium]
MSTPLCSAGVVGCRSLKTVVFVVALFGAMAGPNAGAETVAEEFGKANAAYSAAQYDQAISGYERMIQVHGYDPAVLYNLGNAYLQTEQLGRAILNYERSLMLAPNDPDVVANLQYARGLAGLEVPTPQWWQRLMASMTPNQWAWSASVLLFLWAGAALVYWFKPGPMPVKWWRLALAMLVMGFFLCAAFAGMAAMERPYAVVTAKDAAVLQSPFAKAKQVASLPEGETIAVDKIDKQYQQYVRVRYDKRSLGWVSREQVEAIQPDLWSAPESPQP